MINAADKQACKEVVELWSTGILKQDGVLAKLAAEHPHMPGDRRIAERDLIERTVKAVASCETGVEDSGCNAAGITFPHMAATSWRSDHPYIVTLQNNQATMAYPISGCIADKSLMVGAASTISGRLWELVDPFFESDFITYAGEYRLLTPEQVKSWVALHAHNLEGAAVCWRQQRHIIIDEAINRLPADNLHAADALRALKSY